MVLPDHLHGLRIGDVAGNDQNFTHQTRPKILEGGDRFCRVHPGTSEIQKHRVKVPLLDYGQRLLGARDNVAFTSQSCQQDTKNVADGGFVLDHQNGAKLVTWVQIFLDKASETPGTYSRQLFRAPDRAN